MKTQFTVNNKKALNAIDENFKCISIEPKYHEVDNIFGIESKYDKDESGKFRVADYWIVEGDFSAEELILIGKLIERNK